MLKRLHIWNFRSLRDVEIEFSPVTVLIGKSGAGKSNIVNAIRFVRHFAQHGFHMQEFGGVEGVLCVTRKAPAQVFGFEVALTAPGVEGEFTYRATCAFDQHKGRHEYREKLVHQGKAVFEQAAGKWVNTPALTSPPTPAEPALGTLYGIVEARLVHIVLTRSIGCYDFPGTVLRGSQDRDRDGGLLDHGDNFLRVFDSVASNLTAYPKVREMVAATKRLNASVSGIDLSVDRNQMYIAHRVGEEIMTFPVGEESEGLRRYLAHLLAVYQEPPKQVLVFEEPEKGIYPGALAVLAETFKATAARGTSQVILTTHSPELLDHFPADQIRVVSMENYETRVGPLAEEQRDAVQSSLLEPGELLTVDEARIAEAPAGD